MLVRTCRPDRPLFLASFLLDPSFLTNFSRKSFSANDQVKLVRDFLQVSPTKFRFLHLGVHRWSVYLGSHARLRGMEACVYTRVRQRYRSDGEAGDEQNI